MHLDQVIPLNGPVIDPEFGDLTELVRLACRRRRAERHARARARLARSYQDIARHPRSIMRGLGTLVAQVPTQLFYDWERLEGKGCWGDRGFRNDILRDNPGLKPRTEKLMDRVSFYGAYEPGAEAEAAFTGVRLNTAKTAAQRKTILDNFGRVAATVAATAPEPPEGGTTYPEAASAPQAA
jgi:hypothetical protein